MAEAKKYSRRPRRDCYDPRRAVRYSMLRLQRIRDTPHRLALGLACGVAASFTPFFGFHFVIAGALAWLLGGNVWASLLGTAFGNPLTIAFIVAACMNMGGWILGIDVDVGAALAQIKDLFLAMWGAAFGGEAPTLSAAFSGFFARVFFPYLVGCPIPAATAAFLLYWPLRRLIARMQARRDSRWGRKKRPGPDPAPAEPLPRRNP